LPDLIRDHVEPADPAPRLVGYRVAGVEGDAFWSRQEAVGVLPGPRRDEAFQPAVAFQRLKGHGVQVGHLALVRAKRPEALVDDELLKGLEVLDERRPDRLVARVGLARVSLPPIVDESVRLDLDELSATLGEEPRARHGRMAAELDLERGG